MALRHCRCIIALKLPLLHQVIQETVYSRMECALSVDNYFPYSITYQPRIITRYAFFTLTSVENSPSIANGRVDIELLYCSVEYASY